MDITNERKLLEELFTPKLLKILLEVLQKRT